MLFAYTKNNEEGGKPMVKKDNVMKTITLERHNKTIIRLLDQHGEEIQMLKSRIAALEREVRNVTALNKEIKASKKR